MMMKIDDDDDDDDHDHDVYGSKVSCCKYCFFIMWLIRSGYLQKWLLRHGYGK